MVHIFSFFSLFPTNALHKLTHFLSMPLIQNAPFQTPDVSSLTRHKFPPRISCAMVIRLYPRRACSRKSNNGHTGNKDKLAGSMLTVDPSTNGNGNVRQRVCEIHL